MNRHADLFWLIKRVYYLLSFEFGERFANQEISMQHFLVLSVLESKPNISSAEIARQCFISAQAANAIVARLEAANLVRRKPAKAGGRVLETKLTKRGEAMFAQCATILREIGDRLLGSVSPEEYDAACRVLGAIVGKLDGTFEGATALEA